MNLRAKYISFILGINFLFVQSYANEACIKALKEKAPVEALGIIEARVSQNEKKMKEYKEYGDRIVAEDLNAPDPDLPTLSSKLEETAKAVFEKYHHTYFDIMTSQRTEAIETMKSALKQSKEFGSLSDDTIEVIAKRIAEGGGRLSVPMFGPKPVLYQFLFAADLVNSSKLESILYMLGRVRANIDILADQNFDLNSMTNEGLKDIASIEELKQKFEKLQEEILSTSTIPNDLVKSLVSFAKEYNASNMGGFDVLTSGHNEAIANYEKLINEHAFFKNAHSGEIEDMRFRWHSATTPGAVIELLSPFVHDEGAKKKISQLKLYRRAIIFFQKNPR